MKTEDKILKLLTEYEPVLSYSGEKEKLSKKLASLLSKGEGKTAEIKPNELVTKGQSIKEINRLVELIKLGDNVNVLSRLSHIKDSIITEISELYAASLTSSEEVEKLKGSETPKDKLKKIVGKTSKWLVRALAKHNDELIEENEKLKGEIERIKSVFFKKWLYDNGWAYYEPTQCYTKRGTRDFKKLKDLTETFEKIYNL